MRTDCPAPRETATPPARGRRRLASRLLPARGSRHRRCASAWRRSAPPLAGTDARAAPSHARLQDRADFHHAAAFQDGTTHRELHRLGEVLRLDQGVTPYDILGLRVRPVGDGPLVALDDLAATLQRVPTVPDLPIVANFLFPNHPRLHCPLDLS